MYRGPHIIKLICRNITNRSGVLSSSQVVRIEKPFKTIAWIFWRKYLSRNLSFDIVRISESEMKHPSSIATSVIELQCIILQRPSDGLPNKSSKDLLAVYIVLPFPWVFIAPSVRVTKCCVT